MFKSWLRTKLYLCCISLSSGAFRLFSGNSHDALERKNTIESIQSKNNSCLSISRAYECGKTIALAKVHGFHIILHFK